ncbi:hypothetical protein A6P54_07790 [Bacillus sp. MKU004]|nr:hypothetical protein A6P54_07790 [Bacillus sp. MKU004]
MTIYKELLGAEFKKLHPKLQERYMLSVGKPFQGTGTMSKIETGPAWLKPFLTYAVRRKFLFPESDNDVPFTIKNSCRLMESGETEVYWERSFFFEEVTRHFNAFMTIDAARGVVKDYLGEPSLFYSDLNLSVSHDGGLRIRSGSQRFIAGKFEIKLPSLFKGEVAVEEGYDEVSRCYTIKVDIHNKFIGRMMTYEGTFTAQSG